jgi:hypothetical protein
MASDDYLKGLSIDELDAWYRRLADVMPKVLTPDIKQPLAGEFLLTWLNNRQLDAVYKFDAPEHLRTLPAVAKVIMFHRDVFLTNTRGTFFPRPPRWVGLLPRIQGLPGFTKWDMEGELELNYESLCDPVPYKKDIVRLQLGLGTQEELDIAGSLRGFQLKSTCKAIVFPIENSSSIKVQFKKWYASGTDRYDFDEGEYLTLPNPDYQSNAAHAVKPELDFLRVYHTNAIRLEKDGRAMPYKVEIKPWEVVTDITTKIYTIDTKKRL